MAYPQKFKDVMTILERRIRRGDFLMHAVPSERRIAEETGVSHMTARRAVLELLNRKVLLRETNGSLSVSPEYHADAGAAQVILLYPAYSSPFLTALREAVAATARANGLRIRPVQYVDWTDPVVIDAVGHDGGVIIVPSSPDVPPHILDAIRGGHVAMLQGDLSHEGVPSIQLFADTHMTLVLEHLRYLGHRHIDCISSHVHNPEIDARIGLWRDWLAEHGLAGDLWELAAPSFSDPTPYAYEQVRQLLASGPLRATALVGTTFPAAVGAAKACHDQGLVVGRGVSVCAMNIEWPAQYMTPSITGLDMPDFSRPLGDCFAWFAGKKGRPGPQRLEPAEAKIFIGESTGAPPAVATGGPGVLVR